MSYHEAITKSTPVSTHNGIFPYELRGNLEIATSVGDVYLFDTWQEGMITYRQGIISEVPGQYKRGPSTDDEDLVRDELKQRLKTFPDRWITVLVAPAVGSVHTLNGWEGRLVGFEDYGLFPIVRFTTPQSPFTPQTTFDLAVSLRYLEEV